MEEFKPPWNFFPVHITRSDPFSASIEAGLDQGDSITYSVVVYRDGNPIILCGGSPNWRDSLPVYLEMIFHIRWLAHIEESGEPRYMRLDREHDDWVHNRLSEWRGR